MMNRTLQIVLATFALVLPATAFAQGGGSDTIPELRLEGMPADITACVRACAGGGTPATSCTPTTSADAERRLRALNGQLSRLRRDVRDHERRIAALEAEHERLGDRTEALEGQVGSLTRSLEGLTETVSSLHRYYELVVRDYVALAERVGVNEIRIRELRSDVDALKTRVERLEERRGTVSVGGTLGALVLHAPGDGTTYSAFAIGPRFILRLADQHSLSFDAQALVADDPNPFGTRTRLGYQYAFHRYANVDVGVSGTFASLDSSLDAASAFIGPDVGLNWTPAPWVSLGANLFLGAELDQNSPAFAVGGMGLASFHLP